MASDEMFADKTHDSAGFNPITAVAHWSDGSCGPGRTLADEFAQAYMAARIGQLKPGAAIEMELISNAAYAAANVMLNERWKRVRRGTA